MKSIYCLFAFLLVVILMSCSVADNGTSLQTSLTKPSSLAETVDISTANMPSESSAAPNLTPTTKPPHLSIEECVNLSENKLLGKGYLLAGKKFDMETLTVGEVLDPAISVSVSPAGDALVYHEYIDNSSNLVFNFNNEIKRIPIDTDLHYMNWVSNQTVSVRKDDQLGRSTMVVNSELDERQEIITDLQDFFVPSPELTLRWNGNIPSFDSSLNYALYPSYDGVKLIKVGGQSVVDIIDTSPVLYPPKWSPQGDSFAIFSSSENQHELLVKSADGRLITSTQLDGKYPNYAVASYSWSPNGKRIAFWFSENYFSENEQGKRIKYLTIFNLEDREAMVTCLSSVNNLFDLLDRIVWSPDSKQIAVNVSTVANPQNLLEIIDVESLSYYTLDSGQDFIPTGWISFDAKMP